MSDPLTYKDAGVDIAAGNDLVKKIKHFARATHRPGVLGQIGGFGALFELPTDKYRTPVLVSTTDGVGTKLRLAIDHAHHYSIGQDLVAMCVNDLIVIGAEPLFFLDYYATGRLSVAMASQVIQSIAEGCKLANTALIGGETAEMPGMYADNDYDLAGFCVGAVEKTELVDGSTIVAGDKLIGLPSSGPHSNGYSLIRHILKQQLDAPEPTLIEQLLTPTRIYVKAILALHAAQLMKGAAHITGGGLTENIPRMLPDYLQAKLITDHWQRPAIFHWLQEQGNISDSEMYQTFNCGIGMVICCAANQTDAALAQLQATGEKPIIIGEIISSNSQTPSVIFE
jgi:phosphoribosylformylglycinamidine cyclo-ligase